MSETVSSTVLAIRLLGLGLTNIQIRMVAIINQVNGVDSAMELAEKFRKLNEERKGNPECQQS